jgi:hypothetical protein
VKSTRSDLSFRATIRPLSNAPLPADKSRWRSARIPIPRDGEEPSAVISRLVEQATDLADWG